MEKKLYYQLYDNGDMSYITTLEDAIEIIKCDMEYFGESDEYREFTMIPVWLTDEEYEKLEEADQ